MPDRDPGPAFKAWQTINSRYVKDGVVTGVSAGTGPAGTSAYRTRPVGRDTWGTGAYLLATRNRYYWNDSATRLQAVKYLLIADENAELTRGPGDTGLLP